MYRIKHVLNSACFSFSLLYRFSFLCISFFSFYVLLSHIFAKTWGLSVPTRHSRSTRLTLAVQVSSKPNTNIDSILYSIFKIHIFPHGNIFITMYILYIFIYVLLIPVLIVRVPILYIYIFLQYLYIIIFITILFTYYILFIIIIPLVLRLKLLCNTYT